MHLLIKGGIVGHHSGGVVVDLQAFLYGFHSDGLFLVRNDPMQLSQGQLVAERSIDQIDLVQQQSCLLHTGALAENPGNELKGGHIVLAGGKGLVVRITHEIQTGHAKPFFVDGIIEQREIPSKMRHSDQSIMVLHFSHVTEGNREIPGHDDNFFSVGEFVIQCSAKIEILGFISCCCTHIHSSIQE